MRCHGCWGNHIILPSPIGGKSESWVCCYCGDGSLCVVFGANRDALAEMWEVVGGVFVEEVEPAN